VTLNFTGKTENFYHVNFTSIFKTAKLKLKALHIKTSFKKSRHNSLSERIVYCHTDLNAPKLVGSRKLSKIGLG
jgi:hypothetical protein